MMWIIFALLSAASSALTTILSKVATKYLDQWFAAALCGAVETVLLIAVASYSTKAHATPAVVTSSITGSYNIGIFFVFLAAVASSLSWIFSFSALKTGSTTGVSAIESFSIVFCIILCRVIFGDIFDAKQFIGSLMVGLGVILISK